MSTFIPTHTYQNTLLYECSTGYAVRASLAVLSFSFRSVPIQPKNPCHAAVRPYVCSQACQNHTKEQHLPGRLCIYCCLFSTSQTLIAQKLSRLRFKIVRSGSIRWEIFKFSKIIIMYVVNFTTLCKQNISAQFWVLCLQNS